MTLLCSCMAQAAWALSGSGTLSDPYRIASASDWNELATNVNNGTTYSGKYLCLTADISVTNTMVGNSEEHSFRGTFDGRGHTLTISYNTSNDITAPFRYIQGATFKNLRVLGSISTTANQAAGIAGLNSGAAAFFDQCVTDITINSSSSTFVGSWGRYDYHGGFLARSNDKDVYITDSISAGSIDGTSSTQSNCASFVGVVQNCTVHATRCLSTISYTNVCSFNSLCHTDNSTRSAEVFFYVYGNDDAANAGEKVTTSQVADGSLITALQDGRSTTVWVQNATTHQPAQNIFAFSKAADGYYLIGSEQDWRLFSSVIQTIPTANARMTADISVTTMLGSSDNPFSGIFDGNSHTLTMTYNTTEGMTGPFRYARGATIRNLHTAGTITTSGKFAGGLIGFAYNANTITNCRSSVYITSSVNGDGTHGGFIGDNEDSGAVVTTSFEGCVFDGKLLGSNTDCCGGFVGWSNGNVKVSLTNCLFAPQEVTINASNSYTFSRTSNSNLSNISTTNCYYTLLFGDPQGTAATPTSNQPSNLGTLTAVYSVSGITAYNNGLCQNSLYFCGSPNFTLSVTLASVLGESKYVSTFYHGTLDYLLPAGALAYTAGKDVDKVVFYRIGTDSNVIPKKTAVIIVADASAVSDGKVTLTTLPSTTVTAKDNNILRGSDTDYSVPSGTAYVLGVSGGILGFYPLDGSTIPAGKACYIEE